MIGRSGRGRRERLAGLVAGVCAIGLAGAASDSPLDPAALSAGRFHHRRVGTCGLLHSHRDARRRAGARRLPRARSSSTRPGWWRRSPAACGGWGPTFNEDRCAHCHVNNGRASGARERTGGALEGVLVRLSIPGQSKEGGPMPHPVYGDQLQNRGIPGRVPAEGQAVVTYTAREVSFADGEKVTLRVPHIEFKDLQFGELGGDIMISPRIAPAMVGMGLLEAVPEDDDPAHRRGAGKARHGGQAQLRVGRTRTSRRCWGASAGRPISPTCASRPPAAFPGRHRRDHVPVSRRRTVRPCRPLAWTCRRPANAEARAAAQATPIVPRWCRAGSATSRYTCRRWRCRRAAT